MSRNFGRKTEKLARLEIELQPYRLVALLGIFSIIERALGVTDVRTQRKWLKIMESEGLIKPVSVAWWEVKVPGHGDKVLGNDLERALGVKDP